MSPILDVGTLEFISHSPEQTRRLGARLGALLRGGEVICLEGSLGSGKTCLAQGIGRGWGAAEWLISPSFVLVREYRRLSDQQRLYHIDLYRVKTPAEAWELGLEEYLTDEQGVCTVEWAERARPFLPDDRIWITLEWVDESRRQLRFEAQGARHEALLHEFRKAAFGT